MKVKSKVRIGIRMSGELVKKELNEEMIYNTKGQSAISCSEVLKINRGPDGEIKSYRVRIVAGGHRQVEEVNYTEVFSSVEKCQQYT